jgi:hypothetical protein
MADEEVGMGDGQFRMECPKCGTHSFTVRRDQRAYVHKSQPFELVFSCRCGKQLFGDQIQEEYDRQKAAWEKNPPQPQEESVEDAEARVRAEEEERRKRQLRRAMEYRRKYLAEKRREKAEAERRRKEEEDRRWREKVAQVEAEERDARAAAAAAAANGGKKVKPKPLPRPKPPSQRRAEQEVATQARNKAAKKARAPKPDAPAPASNTAPAKPVEPPKKAEPKPKAEAAPKLVDPEDVDVDPDHPHAEFMPYLLTGQFKDLFPEAIPPDVKSPTLCVWPPCEKNRRKKSKYCSRECSNKNARWRHKMRKRS